MNYARALLTIAAIMVLVLLVSAVYSQKDPAPAYKAVHLMKLTSPKAEANLLTIVAEFNKLYTEIGYPNIRYRVWKISGKQSGQFTHIWESEWPDKATYDKVHGLKEVTELITRHEKELREILKDQLYNRYEELPLIASMK
jgi:hypothetical protein